MPKTLPACRNDLCGQGARKCPTPQACVVPESQPCEPLPWLSLRIFWTAYALGIVSGLVAAAVVARG